MKPFDFDTTWVDKYQNVNKMRFWREDDREERRQMILQARNGGSVNYPCTFSTLCLPHRPLTLTVRRL